MTNPTTRRQPMNVEACGGVRWGDDASSCVLIWRGRQKPTLVSKEIKVASKTRRTRRPDAIAYISRPAEASGCVFQASGWRLKLCLVMVRPSKPNEAKKWLNTRRTWRTDADVRSKQKIEVGRRVVGCQVDLKIILYFRSRHHRQSMAEKIPRASSWSKANSRSRW